MTLESRKYPPELTRLKIVAWCNKAERSQWDVRNKLLAWKIPAGERETIISELITRDLLNEKRYAEAFAHDKSNFNGWGIIKIQMHLKSKGISSRNIADALSSIDPKQTETEVIRLIKKKELQIKNLQLPLKKIKITRFLLSKGFEYDVINKCLDDYFSRPD